MFTDGQAASTLKSANSYVSKLKTLVKVAKDVQKISDFSDAVDAISAMGPEFGAISGLL